MKTKTLLLLISFLFVNISCFEDLFGIEEDDEYYDDNSASDNSNAGYNFTFTCPVGSSNTVPIPAGTTQCQDAYEYFAKVYGCNDSDYFNEANCRMCHDCGIDNYCTVCE